MASIRVRKDNGLLFFDLRVNGVRCREQTALPDTAENRKKMVKILAKIEEDIEAGTFQYRRYFPNSKYPVRSHPSTQQVQIHSVGQRNT